MSWRDDLTARLQEKPCCGYSASDTFATEPSALVALALVQEGQLAAADQVAQWLGSIQMPNGSVGVRAAESEPCWPTSLAVLAWQAMVTRGKRPQYADAIQRAATWTVQQQGLRLDATGRKGHDPSIGAWSWVAETHAWVEPTSLFTLALAATGHAEHPRAKSAYRMLLDRQLPQGGWNYGNTFVLGRELRPHLQPTGMALVALAGPCGESELLRRSLSYLERNIHGATATASLCWSLLALAAHGRWPPQADSWLAETYERVCRRDGSPWKLALVSLACRREESLVLTLSRGETCR